MTHAHDGNILASMDTWEANGTTIAHTTLLFTTHIILVHFAAQERGAPTTNGGRGRTMTTK